MEKKKIPFVVTIAAVFGVVIILTSVIRCLSNIQNRLSGQVQADIQYTADQNVRIMERRIGDVFSLLDGIAGELQQFSVEDTESIVKYLQSYQNAYHFKRLGFVDAKGMSYTTDGFEYSLEDMDSYKVPMSGKRYISDVLVEAIGEAEDVNVLSVPVYEKGSGNVVGAVFATYRTETFRDNLIETANGQDVLTYVIKSNGDIVAGTEHPSFKGQRSYFDMIKLYNVEGEAIISELRSIMTNGQVHGGQVQMDQTYHYYMQPLKNMGSSESWYVCTFIPDVVLSASFNQVWNDVMRLLGIMVAVFIILFVVYNVNNEINEKRLYKLAYLDTLTKDDNYEAFKNKMLAKKDPKGCLIAMDLGEFRVVNNVCGVEMGNITLKKIWEIIKENLTEEELAAHISADFFVIYWEESDVYTIEKRIECITQNILHAEGELKIPRMIPYFGICNISDPQEVEKAYSRARQAKNIVKGRHDLNYSFYDDSHFMNLVENKRLEDNFERGIREKQFEIWYQPKFNPETRAIVGAEALVRWRDEGKLISPGKFIPLFEKNGMISALDEYVFKEVCMKQKEWLEKGWSIFPISINISRASLFFRDIATKYERIIQEVGLSPEFAQLEITESATLENGDIESLMSQFHQAGFRLLLDDFGNGYSSLSTLNKMSFDTLKLDKSLIDYIGDQNGEELLYHTICLAKKFGLTITAEGVEKEEQVVFLQRLKCDDIQGFYFSRPLPVEEFEKIAFSVAC